MRPLKFLSLALAVLMLVLPLMPAGGATLKEQIQTVSATQTNSAVTFTTPPGILVLVNDGPNTVYITLASTTATTIKFALKNGESLSLTFASSLQAAPTGAGFICTAGQTASVRVGAWR
jgi:hypothetical protein